MNRMSEWLTASCPGSVTGGITLMETVAGKSHDLKEPAGPWHFRAQEEPVGFPAAGWSQDLSATPAS